MFSYGMFFEIWSERLLMALLVIPGSVALFGGLIAGWGYLLYIGASWVFS